MNCRAIVFNILLFVAMTTNAVAQKSRGETYKNAANELVRTGNYELAVRQYDKAIERSPKTADYYTLRGYAKDMLGNFEAGIADFNKAISLNKKDAVAYGNRGYAYSMLGKDVLAVYDRQHVFT